MNGKFFDLKKEKQDRMINAALKCFAIQGYRHASTDDIVKEAAISKGLLFHYFGSKLGVFQFVYEYSVRYMSLELRTCVDKSKTELIDVQKQIEFARMQAMKGYPYMQLFLYRTQEEDSCEALEVIDSKRDLLDSTYQEIYSKVDYSTLPAGVEPLKLQNVMNFTIWGLLNQSLVEHSFQPQMLYEDICSYLDMLQKMCAHN